MKVLLIISTLCLAFVSGCSSFESKGAIAERQINLELKQPLSTESGLSGVVEELKREKTNEEVINDNNDPENLNAKVFIPLARMIKTEGDERVLRAFNSSPQNQSAACTIYFLFSASTGFSGANHIFDYENMNIFVPNREKYVLLPSKSVDSNINIHSMPVPIYTVIKVPTKIYRSLVEIGTSYYQSHEGCLTS